MRTITIRNFQFTIDDEDMSLVGEYMWRLHPQGYIHGYKKGDINRTETRLHRLVMKAPKNKEVDHIDYDKSHNHKSNLRLCDRDQNKANTRIISTNTTGYKGVSYQDGKWQTSIRVNGVLIYLGRHSDKHEAAHIYNQVAEQIFGDFAWLNPIEVES